MHIFGWLLTPEEETCVKDWTNEVCARQKVSATAVAGPPQAPAPKRASKNKAEDPTNLVKSMFS